MRMAINARHWTRADLDTLPDDGNRYEIIGGQLLVSAVPRPAHEAVLAALTELLAPYCRRHGSRASSGKSAVVTNDAHAEPDLVVRPRVSPAPSRWDDAPLPELVVEVLSDFTRRHDLITKRGFYLACGIPEYWIVDPEERCVRVIRQSGERIERTTLSWQARGAAEPLRIDLARLFEEELGL